MLPTKYEEKAFSEYVAPYLAVRPDYEIAFSGVKTFKGQNLMCSCGVFQGLWDNNDSDQILVKEFHKQYALDDETSYQFVDEIIKQIYNVGEENPIVRICVDKFCDGDMKKQYTKWLDLNLNLIKTSRDEEILEAIIYFLLRYSAIGKHLVKAKRSKTDGSKIWTLFSEPTRGSELSLPFQT